MRISLHAFVTLLAALLLISFSNLASAACGAAPAASVDMALRFVGALHTWTKVDNLGAPTAGDVVYDTTGNALSVCNGTSWQTLSAGGSASGSTGYVQFNNAGAFAADSSLFWDNTNKRLGIGTATPGAILDLYASSPTLRLNGNSDTGTVGVNLAPYGGHVWSLGSAGSASADVAGKLYVRDTNASAYRLVIDTSGNVGIGTTTPTNILHIVDSSSLIAKIESTGANGNGAELQLKGGGTNAHWALVTNKSAINGAVDSLGFYKLSGTVGTKMVIANSGNVGIGTTTPEVPLHVVGSAGVHAAYPYLYLRDTDAAGASTTGGGITIQDSTGATNARFALGNSDGELYISAVGASNGMYFQTGGLTNRVRIDSAGNVGIGTTSPAGKIDVSGVGGLIVSGVNLDPAQGYSLAPLANSGKLLIGWNRQAGAGEIDLISNRQGGNAGGFIFYDYTNAGVLNKLLTLPSSGGIQFPDGTTQTTAASGGGISNVTTATCSYIALGNCTATCATNYFRTGCNASAGSSNIAYPTSTASCYCTGNASATCYAICAQ